MIVCTECRRAQPMRCTMCVAVNPAPVWLDAPDGPGWWWMRDLDGLDYIVHLYDSRDGLRTIHGSYPSHMPGRKWQRVAPPREG